MTTWVMWITLLSGQAFLGGEYQSLERCTRAIETQRAYWASQRVDKLECKLLGSEDLSAKRQLP